MSLAPSGALNRTVGIPIITLRTKIGLLLLYEESRVTCGTVVGSHRRGQIMGSPLMNVLSDCRAVSASWSARLGSPKSR